MSASPPSSRTQSGNVFFALFGAVGLVGVIGAASMTILKGPVAGMQKVTKYTVAENAMIAAGRLSIVAANADCDNDGVNEPLEWADAGAEPAPSGGGLIPSAIGAAKQDPWGNTYGYCVWDHGAEINNAGCGGASQNRLAGNADIADDAGGIVIALISSGPDRVFQTSCGDDPDYVTKPSGSDDIVLTYTYGEASDLAGGLWQAKGNETAEIARDLEVYSAADPNTQIFGLDSASDPTKPSIKVDFIQKLSAGAPGVTFLSDLLVDGGNVGIGTTDPGVYKLNVKGGGLYVNDIPGNGIRLLGHGTESSIFSLNTGGGHNPLVISGSTIGLSVDGNTTKSLYINNSGNVGIGTTSPADALDVNGTIISRGQRALAMLGDIDTAKWLMHLGAYDLTFYSDHGNATKLTSVADQTIYGRTFRPKVKMTETGDLEVSGKAGIGTEAPARQLHVVSSDTAGAALLESTGSFSALRFKANSTGASKDLLMHYGGNSAAQQNQLRFGRYAYDGGAWEASPVVFDMDAPANSLIVREDGWVLMGVAADNHGLYINDSSTKYYQVMATNNNASGRAGFMARHGAHAGVVLHQTSVGDGILENSAGNILYNARGSGRHSFRTTNSESVRFTIENDGRLNAHNNRIINLATPTAASDAATKAYVDTTAADAAAAAADNLGNHTATQNLNMANRKIVSLAGPTAGTDAATKAYVDLTAASAASAAADNLGNHTATQTLAMGAYGISSSAGVIRDGNGGWVRTYGNTGWYNSTHGGGWYMIDTDWVRAYLNKNVMTGGVMRADGGFNVDGFDTISSNGSELRLRHTTAGGYTSIRMDGADSTKTLRLHYGGSADNVLRFGSYADNFSATWHGNPVMFDLDAPDQSMVLNGAGNLTIKGDIVASNGTHAVQLRGNDGAIELQRGGGGAYIDFKDSAAEDFDIRLQRTSNTQLTMSGGVLSMSNQKITNVANPTAAQDAATKAYVDSNGGARSYKSDFVAYSSGNLATFAHGFGSRPAIITIWLKNITAEHGWSVGDQIVISSTSDPSSGLASGVQVYADDDNIYIRMGTWSIHALTKTGGYATLTASRWQIGVGAVE